MLGLIYVGFSWNFIGKNRKEGEVLFKQCGKKIKCGLIIERILENHSNTLDKTTLYVILKE